MTRGRRVLVAVALAVVLLVLQQTASIAGTSRFADALQNALHVPWFAALTALAIAISRPLHQRPRLRWTLLLLALPTLAWLTEYVQQFTGRSFEWSDFGRDCVAAAGTFAVYRGLISNSPRPSSPNPRSKLLWLALAAALFSWALANLLLVSAAYLQRDLALPLLLNPDSALSRVFLWPPPLEHQPDGGSGAASGEPGIQLYSRAAGWDPLSLREPSTRLGDYAFMCTEIDLRSRAGALLLLRVHDFTHERSVRRYEDRFNLEQRIAPGHQTIAIPISSLRNAPRGRSMNLADIAEILVLILSPPEPQAQLRVLRIYVGADCASGTASQLLPRARANAPERPTSR